jgi:hypothetical protein
VNDVPKFLIEWSSPWQEFLTAIRPALMRSPEPLAGEAPTGIFPYRGILISWILEVALLVAVIVIPTKLASMRPYDPPPMPKYDVIYFSGEELPRTEDNGGAESGSSGRSGGQEAHHPTQTIRVARGSNLREQVVDAPKLDLPVSKSAVANLLAFKPVPGPAPAEGMSSSRRSLEMTETPVAPVPAVQSDRLRAAPALNAGVVAPSPDIQREQMRATPALAGSVVPPSPTAPQRDLAALRLPGSQTAEVVPPPVSAPERDTGRNPRLTLPAPTIVAPPPTVTQEVASLGPGFGPGELRKQIVPPPVQLGGTSSDPRAASGFGSAAVVPPPVQVGGGSTQRQGLGGGLSGGATVVAPPVQVTGSGSAQRGGFGGWAGGTGVVPPPPSAGGGSSIAGMGRGTRGSGLGGPFDSGSIAAPPKSGGSAAGNGVVVSSQPGSKVGLPGGGGSGALAMSPAGGAKPGLGGSGGGAGIGQGNGPGSGFSGPGSGAGKGGTGLGSDTTAHGGISPYPGPGGAGSGTNGKPAMPGVAVSGGETSITLPSFADGGSQPTDPSRSSAGKGHKGFEATVVATARSGGAFNYYDLLKGDNYTIYIDTAVGTLSMQYADPTSAEHRYSADLTAPQPIRKDLPPGLPKARLVIACNLDAAGSLRNLKVLDAGPAVMTAKVLAALPHWKFTPAQRGNQAIEVTAILGFNIDTNDRF